jgi:membrane fusion protein (multidrug efflux system)
MKRAAVLAGVGVFVTIIVVGGGLGLYKYRAIEAAAANAPHFEPADAVQLAKARTVSWRPMADLVGTVLSLRSVRVSNEVAGRVKEVKFESGAVVNEGDVLITLDDSTERADLAAARASVRVAEANVEVMEVRLDLAHKELDRMQGAADAKAVAAMDLDRSKSELRRIEADRGRLEAEVDQAKARVDQVQARIDKMVIRAPFKARAGLRNIHEGQYLAEGTNVAMLEEVSERIYLDFPIPQEYAPRVRPGLTVMATSDVMGAEPVKIEVVAVDAEVNNETRNLRVRAVVDNKEGRLRPGMFVQIRVPVEEAKEYVAVPATAIRRASYADQVFVVGPSGKADDPPQTMRASQRFVKLGPTIGEDVIVLEGLKAGDTVAATGSFKLHDGSKVMPVEASKETAEAGR